MITSNVPEVYFSMDVNMEDTKQIHIKLQSQLHKALKMEAAFTNTTIQELVVDLIEQRILRSEFATMIERE